MTLVDAEAAEHIGCGDRERPDNESSGLDAADIELLAAAGTAPCCGAG